MTSLPGGPQVNWISTLPASERFHQRYARSCRLLAAGGLVATIMAAACLIVSVLRLAGNPYVEAGVGCVLVVSGVSAVVSGRRAKQGPLAAVGISTQALALRWQMAGDQVLPWKSATFRVKIQDMRGYRPTHTLDSFLAVSGRTGGLTAEACDAILVAAKAEEITIVPRPWKGSWGGVYRYELRPHQPGPA